MFDWIKLSITERKTILDAVSAKTGYPPNVIEKDWWVTLALRAVFNTPWAPQIVFKGGTSLSKSWNLIERFSEDIDLAIDKSVHGFISEELSKGDIRRLRQKSAVFMEESFIGGLQESLVGLGIDAATFTLSIQPIAEKDIEPRILELSYLSVINQNDYLLDRVLIEIGSRSLREPCSLRPITSFISESFPEATFADPPFMIETVHPERTFLEKVCLLHEEFSKAPEKMRHERLSRHLYDLHRIMDAPSGLKALTNPNLFNTIVAHREKYNAIRGISYSNHTFSEIDFIPPAQILTEWRADYNKMLEFMIYGNPPNFDQLIQRMKVLRERFRSVNISRISDSDS